MGTVTIGSDTFDVFGDAAGLASRANGSSTYYATYAAAVAADAANVNRVHVEATRLIGENVVHLFGELPLIAGTQRTGRSVVAGWLAQAASGAALTAWPCGPPATPRTAAHSSWTARS